MEKIFSFYRKIFYLAIETFSEHSIDLEDWISNMLF